MSHAHSISMGTQHEPGKVSAATSPLRGQHGTKASHEIQANPLWQQLATRVTSSQSTLTIGSADDALEREAERNAEGVMSTPEPLRQPSSGRAPRSTQSSPHDAGAGARAFGRSLSPQERAYFEPRFGVELGDVRLHEGAEAHAAARQLGARAYTLGSDVVLGAGEYSEGTSSGRRLLAHELSHVIQQRRTGGPAVLQLSRDPDIVHNGYHSFYLRTGAGARELALQVVSAGGQAVTVKLAHMPSATMREGTFQLPAGRSLAPRILTETQGLATIDLDGDGAGDLQILTSVESSQQTMPTTATTPNSVDRRRVTVREVYALARWGSTRLFVEAPPQLADDLVWAPRWRWATHPHPNIGHVWQDTRGGRYVIPPPGASLGHLDLNGPPAFASAGVNVVSRANWGARAPITSDPNRSYEPYTEPLTAVYDSIVVHHAGNRGYRTMSEIQAAHQDDQDRADVGYHFGVSMSGVIYEGRPINIRGAHVDGANTGKIGIVLMADLDTADSGMILPDWSGDDELTDRMQGALIRLIEQLVSQYPGIRYLGGHKEFDTRRHCPGDLPMGRMSAWRAATGLAVPP
ncbi:MAG: DUF4157 domain-containing protein [Enhygromyxa sp.]